MEGCSRCKIPAKLPKSFPVDRPCKRRALFCQTEPWRSITSTNHALSSLDKIATSSGDYKIRGTTSSGSYKITHYRVWVWGRTNDRKIGRHMPCVNQCIEFACCNRIRSTVLLVMYRIYAWRNQSCIIMHREISLYARLVGIINLRARESSCDM